MVRYGIKSAITHVRSHSEAAFRLIFAVVLLSSASASPVYSQALETARRSVVSVLPEWPPDQKRIEEPEGSGVVILDGRTIVTAFHVVAKARSIFIRTFDGDILEAKLAGGDGATDIAVLVIERSLPTIGLAEKEAQLGESVCAIGNAFGLGLSVACGVASSTHRAGVGFNRIEDFIQTDAAVNPGSSGGALVTRNGQFIGLLSAIFTKRSDANIGVNFAVSAKLVLRVAKQVRDHGKITWPSSGLFMTPVPKKGQSGKRAAEVKRIRPGSPGALAGFQVGDQIIKAGSRRVRKPADFTSVLAGTDLGSDLTVAVNRNGQNIELQLKVMAHQIK